MVRGHFSSLLAEAEDSRGLPRFVGRDFTRYLACGVPAHGFARLVCRQCRAEVLVPFSCKSRGVCPSCNARRANDTALRLVERVLPRAPYRQWTLSFPVAVRFCLARDTRLLSEVLALFVRALFAFQRRTARRLGVPRPRTGAVAFVQRFGSALQLTPHFHVLPPEAVFEEATGGLTRLVHLPPPTDAEVERLAVTLARRVLARLRPRRVLDEESASEEALELLHLEAVKVPPSRTERLRRPGRRCAFVEGFSLHANTGLHEHDVRGLQQLCSYGARGPLSLERLSALPDGRLAHRMKRPSPSGQTHLVLSPVAFLRRLAALVPPPRANLVRYFGVLAPDARLRPSVVPAPPPASALPVTDEALPLHLTPPARPRRSRRPIPWAELLRRTFGTGRPSLSALRWLPPSGRRRPPLLHHPGHPRAPAASLPAAPPRPGHLPAPARLLVSTSSTPDSPARCRPLRRCAPGRSSPSKALLTSVPDSLAPRVQPPARLDSSRGNQRLFFLGLGLRG